MLEVTLIPCLSDNYAYLLEEDEAGLCAVIDPPDAAPIVAALEGRRLTHILNTHHHADHVGGNLALKALFGAEIVGPGIDRDRIPGIDLGVDEASGWRFGPHPVRVLDVPAHTRSHIAFVIDGKAFTGDTLFAMGCGRLFEGTPAMLWAAMQKLMALPDTTAVYCGHEYTQNNGRFALTLEPDNETLQARMREVDALRAQNKPTIPTTIGLEKRTNPFLRPDSPTLRATLGLRDGDDVRVLAEIRHRKDVF